MSPPSLNTFIRHCSPASQARTRASIAEKSATTNRQPAFAMNARVTEKDLRITIPESLDYYHVFDDIFEKYLKRAELVRVKTTNMGSLYELEYAVTEADEEKEKEMIDAIRVRNGNLNIVCGRRDRGAEAL